MKRKNWVALAVLLACLAAMPVMAQNNLGHLRSWAGKYPTDRKGKVKRRFFALPEIRQPLLKLLKRSDYNLLTSEYEIETPIKRIGDYLVVKVCRQHACDTDEGGFAINLTNGFIFVRLQESTQVRWFGSNGTYTDLPQAVLDYLNDFSAT